MIIFILNVINNLCLCSSFTMRNGAQFCVNPSAEWVQKIIKAKDKALAAKVSTTGSQATNSH